MLVELIVTALVAAFVAVVVLGHVLLVAAIYKCLREDNDGGRDHRTAERTQSAAGDAEPSVTKLARRRGATCPASAGGVIRLVHPDREHPQHS